MIIPDSKKAVSVILSKYGKDGSEKSAPVKPEASVDGSSSVFHAIAEDILIAIKRESAQDLAQALSDLSQAIDTEEDGDDGESESPELG